MIDKKKIVKVGLGVSATLVVGTALGITVADNNIDHVNKLCPFVNILGMEHQAKAINEDEKLTNEGYIAYYNAPQKVQRITQICEPLVAYRDNGEPIYYAPDGYVLIDGQCIKYESCYTQECVIISKAEEVVNDNGTISLKYNEVNRMTR